LSVVWGKEGETGGGRLLLRRVVCEADAFGDVALQAFYAGLEEGLFVLVEAGEWVVGLLCSGSLSIVSKKPSGWEVRHTPSSTGTEKKSQPVSLTIASPPGTPGR
jgi:hypothetical protein